MADEKTVLQYKGRPLMRKDNMIHYGSMADSHIVMLQILETKKVQDTDIATRVSVELQLTDPNARAKDRIVKKSEKDGFFTALVLGSEVKPSTLLDRQSVYIGAQHDGAAGLAGVKSGDQTGIVGEGLDLHTHLLKLCDESLGGVPSSFL